MGENMEIKDGLIIDRESLAILLAFGACAVNEVSEFDATEKLFETWKDYLNMADFILSNTSKLDSLIYHLKESDGKANPERMRELKAKHHH